MQNKYFTIIKPLEYLIIPLDSGKIPTIELAELSINLGIYKDIAPTIQFDYRIINKPFGKCLKVTKLDDWVIYISFNNLEIAKYFIIDYLLKINFIIKK